MPEQIKKQVPGLAARCVQFSAAHGVAVATKLQEDSQLYIQWIGYLAASQKTGVADSLLEAAAASVREVAACLSLGLVRPALFALRTQVDLVLAWLYFKDHLIEWGTVNDAGSGYKLKREVLEYLSEHYRGFNARYQALKDVITRQFEDPYRLLSAHVHAQSTPALPTAANLVDVVYEVDLCLECATMSREVGEYLSDVLVSVYGSKWTALPDLVRKTVDTRLVTKKACKDKFYGSI